MSSLSDKFLEFRLIRLGDESAFGEFYERTVSQIRAYLLSRVGEAELANDLTEDAFLELWQMIFERGGVKEGNLRGLLFVIAKRQMFDHFRREKPGRVVTDELLEETKGSEDFLKQLELGAEMVTVRQALILLSPLHQTVITLRYFDELEIEEIAMMLEKSQGAIRVLLHRALKELRRRLSL